MRSARRPAHRCFFANRLAITWLTADSTRPVEIRSPHRVPPGSRCDRYDRLCACTLKPARGRKTIVPNELLEAAHGKAKCEQRDVLP